MTIDGEYLRLATLDISDVIPYVFTKEKRRALFLQGLTHNSVEWASACRKVFSTTNGDKIVLPMTSDRYQLFAEKGTMCVKCGVLGKFFAIERATKDFSGKFHLNLYAIDKDGTEIMLTKDHIIPRSKGGKNKISNYQVLCRRCNKNKADDIEHA